IRCRKQICCKTDDIGPPCDRPGAAETSEGFEAPLSMPVPFQSLRAARRVWLRKMENVRLRIYRLGLPGPPPGCMPPFLPPFMAPLWPPAPPPVPVMSPLARISLPPKKPPWPPPATPPEGIWRFWTAPPAAPDSGSPTSPPPAVNAINAVGAKKMTVNPRISLRMALLRMGNTWEIPNRHVGSQLLRTQEHATHVKRGTEII